MFGQDFMAKPHGIGGKQSKQNKSKKKISWLKCKADFDTHVRKITSTTSRKTVFSPG
jgi:hypothetical protein